MLDAMTDTNKNGRDKSREALRQREAGTRRLRSTPSQHQPAPPRSRKSGPHRRGAFTREELEISRAFSVSASKNSTA
jgi:hypothetical protein